MMTRYQVWDDDTGNIVATFETQDAVVDFLRAMLDRNGPTGVSDLAIIEFPTDGTDPVTVLEGSELLAGMAIST